MTETSSAVSPALADVSESDELLLCRGDAPHRPSLENRVAYQWELQQDTLGFRNGARKDLLLLRWLGEAVGQGRAASVLDVGCAYGNLLLMLNAYIGRRADVRMVGVDLDEGAFRYSQAFAERVPGYGNCSYRMADLSKRLPFDDASFDAINLGDVLEHMERPEEALRELIRIAKPGGIILISTPLKNSVFKRLAGFANRMVGGRLYKQYYRGKDADLNAAGEAVMHTRVGHDHVSEMTHKQLKSLVRKCGLAIEAEERMPVMSGSKWFDKHPFLLAALMLLEAVHDTLRLASWAHAVCFRLRVPAGGQAEGRV